jgi:hypothetical protein
MVGLERLLHEMHGSCRTSQACVCKNFNHRCSFPEGVQLQAARVSGWRKPFIEVPKQAGPNDCLFFVWKYTEYYDGNKVTEEINPVMRDVN